MIITADNGWSKRLEGRSYKDWVLMARRNYAVWTVDDDISKEELELRVLMADNESDIETLLGVWESDIKGGKGVMWRTWRT